MRAYIAIKHHIDNRNREHIHKISITLEKFGWETICVTRDLEKWGQLKFDSFTLMRKAFHEIDKSDLIVIDLTEKGVGIGIEAGYAFAKGKSILTIAKTGSHISTTLQGISQTVLFYSSLDDVNSLFDQFFSKYQIPNTYDSI